ncbi:MAG: hypothetical protein M3N26_02985, partial [Pseudomonadota bacterium]|nr:hypothetical protein [Pseudomonadota bacterium]
MDRAPPLDPDAVPDANTAIVQVVGTDDDGEAIGRPVEWSGTAPIVMMRPERRDQPALAPGERVLAALRPIGRGRFEGRTLRRLSDAPG